MDQTSPSAGEYHLPAMVQEVVALMAPVAPGVVVDATYGGGGHTAALLEAAPGLRILAIDRDPDATARVPVDTRVRAVTANFADLHRVLTEAGIGAWIDEHDPHGAGGGLVAGVLLDLGVSSHQLDRPERGFSYRTPGPLDMRMGPDARLTAADVVNGYGRDQLADLFRRYGEERYAGRIADHIVRRRPFTDTGRLAAAVAEAVPAPARRRRHPARKVFQAIRIEVNGELAALAAGLDAAVDHLRPAGRIAVISYHSLEDRIVKRRFATGAGGCVCPPELPVCVCDSVAELRTLTRKALRPTAEEVAANPRSRSAVLRAAEKVGA